MEIRQLLPDFWAAHASTGLWGRPVTHAGMSTSVLSDQLGNKLEQSGNPLNVAVVFSPTGRRRNLWC